MPKKKSFYIYIIFSFTFILSVLLSPSLAVAKSPNHPHWGTTVNVCTNNQGTNIFCDDFNGRTHYQDEHSWANWFRFHDGTRPASYYDSLPQSIRMRVSTEATTEEYSNAEVATTELYEDNPYLLYGENTRVDIRMRFSPNMNGSFFDPGTATGTAGFLFWNYYQGTKDPIHGQFDPVRDAFGFTWASDTAPGLVIFKSVGGNVSIVPMDFILPGLDITEFHTYSIERRPTSLKFYIDGLQVDEMAINQPGELQLPADHKFNVDFWADNASYFFNSDGSIVSVFHDLQEDQWLETDYVKVSEL